MINYWSRYFNLKKKIIKHPIPNKYKWMIEPRHLSNLNFLSFSIFKCMPWTWVVSHKGSTKPQDQIYKLFDGIHQCHNCLHFYSIFTSLYHLNCTYQMFKKSALYWGGIHHDAFFYLTIEWTEKVTSYELHHN